MRQLGLLLSLLAAGLAHGAAATPNAYRAHYDLSVGALTVGTMVRTLEVTADGRYRYESHMRTSGLAALFRREHVAETSHGRLVDGRYTPQRYTYHNARKRRHFELAFDHEHGVVRRVDGSSAAWQQAFAGALFDKLVYQAQIVLDLAHGPADLAYGIADRDELKHYLLRRVGTEQVRTPHGDYVAARLERSQAGSTRRTTVWCAEALGWMPVRVDYQEKDGSVTTALLRELSYR